MVQRSHVDFLADEIFDLFEVVDVRELEIGLDLMLPEALQVLDIELRCRVSHHILIGLLHRGIL